MSDPGFCDSVAAHRNRIWRDRDVQRFISVCPLPLPPQQLCSLVLYQTLLSLELQSDQRQVLLKNPISSIVCSFSPLLFGFSSSSGMIKSSALHLTPVNTLVAAFSEHPVCPYFLSLLHRKYQVQISHQKLDQWWHLVPGNSVKQETVIAMRQLTIYLRLGVLYVWKYRFHIWIWLLRLVLFLNWHQL